MCANKKKEKWKREEMKPERKSVSPPAVNRVVTNRGKNKKGRGFLKAYISRGKHCRNGGKRNAKGSLNDSDEVGGNWEEAAQVRE